MPLRKQNLQERPVRQTERLHRGRLSTPGANYFVTMATAGREPWLALHDNADLALAAIREWHNEQDGRILAATVMPDHQHVVFQLGTRLNAGQCVGRWKSRARQAVNYLEDWQRDFWEHRLRDDEDWEDYALYVFLNPYRAGLIGPQETWPWWWAPDPQVFRFTALLVDGKFPPLEWIDWPDERFNGLQTGE